MDAMKMQRISWYVLGAAACMQVLSLFAGPFRLIHGLSLLLFVAGIHIHLRAKGYRPFIQWQLYIFPFLAAVSQKAAILATLAVLWHLSGLRTVSETAVQRGVKGESGAPAFSGAIAGMIVGIMLIHQPPGSRLDDSPGRLTALGIHGLLSAFIGGVIVWSADRIPREIRAGRPWKKIGAAAGAVVAILAVLWYLHYQEVR